MRIRSNLVSLPTRLRLATSLLLRRSRLHWGMDPWLDIRTLLHGMGRPLDRLVADLDGEARRIIDFCGLDWDDRCLRFWETGRTVPTLSADQVRQPLYERSVGRHARWGASLDPLRSALGDAIARYEADAAG